MSIRIRFRSEMQKDDRDTELLSLNSRSPPAKNRDNPSILWKLLIALLLLLILVLIIIIAILVGKLTPTCAMKNASPRTAPVVDSEETGVFDSLTHAELETVRDYMHQKSGIPLVEIENAKPDNAYIYLIDLQLPPKSKVLQYLDKKGAKPKRKAKVFVTRGDLQPPVLEEYLVDIEAKTHELYKNPSYARDSIPHSSRPLDPVEVQTMVKLYNEGLGKVSRILEESYGAKYVGCDKTKEPCLTIIDVAPRGRSSGERQSWAFLLRDVHGYYLHPVGFQILVNHRGSDTSTWSILKYYYNQQLFDSAEALIEAYDSGRVGKIKLPLPDKDDTDLYSSLNQRGDPSGDALRPPVLVYPDGPRYTINGHQVTYMNWRFDFRMNPSTGIQLFDVRYNNERIVYEIGNADAIVFYSGHDPMQGMVNFYDASWLLGAFAFELAKGIDCPETATYFNFPFIFNSHKVKMNRNSICLFEHDNGVPLGRHYSADFVHGKGYRNYGGMVDYVLILRYIPVIWNYDYVIDYIFHQDGVLEVRVATTGYLQTTFYSKKEERYAYKIQDNVVGPMHHHVLNFKADVDVAGTQNRFATLDIKIEDEAYPWSEGRKVQKYFETTEFKTEKAATVKYDFNSPKYYLVYNNKSQNSLGYNRGLRVKLSGMSKLVMPFDGGDNNPVNGAAQSQYQLSVTRQRDSEASSTSIYTQNEPYNPVVDFQKYIDNDENIMDEDLVVWATLGVHHIPSVEDVPVTTTSSNRASLFLVPYNYHEVSPMVQSRDLVSIVPSEDLSSFEVERNGVESGVGCVPEKQDFSYNGTNFL